jgi:RHS repeat-associated protein
MHTGTQGGEFMSEERLVNPPHPLGRRLNRKRVRQMREMEIRPGPVPGVLDQPCADWVAKHVAEDREEMAVLLNGKTFEPALPDMAMTAVVPMVATDVAGHPPLHEWAESFNGGGCHNEMKMIGHQAEAEYLDGMSGFGGAEQIEEGRVVAVFVKDGRSPVATVQHVIGVTSFVAARNPRHEALTIEDGELGRQWKSSLSPFLTPNNTTTSYAYDLASRLTGITHNGPNGIIEALTYQYDAAGNRLSLSRSSGTASLLPTAVANASYDAANEQTAFAGATLQYDANGNLTNDGVNSYQWDARNRLVGISGGVTASFNYDAFGRRVSKVIGSTALQFLYDRKDIAAEIGGGAVGANYLRALNINEPFIRQAGINNENYHTDALGSSLVLSNAQGTSGTMYTYEPFGKTTATGASANSFQFTGQENDGTGLLYYRARYYSPVLQRFISEDPSGSDAGINFYEYALNDPVNFIDPLGLAGSSTSGGRGNSSGQSGFDRSHLGDIGDAMRAGVDPSLGSGGLTMNKLDTLVQINNLISQNNLTGQQTVVVFQNGRPVAVYPKGTPVLCNGCTVVPGPDPATHIKKPVDIPQSPVPRIQMPGPRALPYPQPSSQQPLGKRK